MAKTKKPIELPNTLSGLLRLAVKDARSCERSKNYRLNMNTWHRPDGDKCEVCMAGAVMARSLKADRASEAGPDDYFYGIGRVCAELYAIDCMRSGSFGSAAWYLKTELPIRVARQVRRAVGLVDGHAPWNRYLEAADILEEAGF